MESIDKSGYLRTVDGMISGAIVVLAFIGGIVNIFSFGFTGMLGFCFWFTFFVECSLLLTHVFQVYEAIKAKFEWLWKVEFGYVAVSILLYVVALILSLVAFGASAVFGYFLLVLLGVVAFRRYRIYRSGGGGAAAANPPENIEQA